MQCYLPPRAVMSSHDIHVLDGDSVARRATVELIETLGFRVSEHASGAGFLEVVDRESPAVVVLECDLFDHPALEVHQELARIPWIRVLVVGCRVGVRTAVEHMRLGAIDVLEKPLGTHDLSQRLPAVVREAERIHAEGMKWREVDRLVEKLSEEELDVMDLLVRGSPVKAIAHRIDVSERTVERRRSRIFDTLAVHSVIDLARLMTQREQWHRRR